MKIRVIANLKDYYQNNNTNRFQFYRFFLDPMNEKTLKRNNRTMKK